MSQEEAMTASSCELCALSRSALQAMRDAGAEVLECRGVRDKGGLEEVAALV